ncbi:MULTISPECIES: calcium-binding protein [unclassified Anabaena]|uniref:calcium-binding protein n=1 Tax=unclassified Anabaena TaxID=2619674 RepID=UPI001448728B|nr:MULTISPECIES: calcium-binding protein [unclassified Anabaena]MTJ07822.1 hypothetical protein [Anabaena sp. UHCC 0204]MTJ51674.1 hypothetical protein [Anabaena sp. UHCC 0253]
MAVARLRGILTYNDSTSRTIDNRNHHSTDRVRTGSTPRGGPRYTTYYNYYGEIQAGSGNDIIYGADYNISTEKIYGRGGNDRIVGAKGNDLLDGGEGNDTLEGGEGNDTLYGQNGNDILSGGAGADIIYGGSGSDVLFTGNLRTSGSDDLYGGSQSDIFVLGEAAQAITTSTGGFDAATFFGGFAANASAVLFSTYAPTYKITKDVASLAINGIKSLFGITSTSVTVTPPPTATYAMVKDFNPIEDIMIIPLQQSGRPNVFIGDGNNLGDLRFNYVDSQSSLFAVANLDYTGYFSNTLGWDALDTFYTNHLAKSALIIDSNGISIGENSVSGLPSDITSSLSGLGTNRFLVVGALGPQNITGTQNGDNLYGSKYNDTIYGYANGQAGVNNPSGTDTGTDNIYGFGGNDTIYGGSGNDYLYGGDGIDYLYGGNNDDRLYGDNGSDRLYGDSGNDYLYGGNDTDFLYGGVGIDRLYGDAGNDYLYGQNDTDYLYGRDGNDYLYGGAGNDYLYGDAGNDKLYGSGGNDNLYGGTGADKFVLETGITGRIVIKDFKTSESDRLVAGSNTTSFNTSNPFRNVNGSAEYTFSGGATFVIEGIAASSLNGLFVAS